MDIKDFDLGWFSKKQEIIGVAKHLCGAATDLTIKSLQSCKMLPNHNKSNQIVSNH